MRITTPSGCAIEHAEERAIAFLREEWAYYDAIADEAPDRIVALDVIVPVMMNAYSFNASAAKLRAIHRGLAHACEPALGGIPIDADLRSFDPELRLVHELLSQAVAVPGVLLPVATKVLHRKRPRLLPILDNVVLDYYLTAAGQRQLISQSQDKSHAADVAVRVLRAFRDDLNAAYTQLAELGALASAAGYSVTPLRLLELLVWTEVEPRGYYRT